MTRKHPTDAALILTDEHDEPIVLSGADIGKMFDEQTLKVYPATYRVVYNSETRH